MKHLYFAACAPKGGVYHYTLSDGSIRFVEKTDCENPMYLDVTDRDMEIVLQHPFPENRFSGLVHYDIEDFSLVNPTAPQSTMGYEGCHLSRFCGNTYVANYSSGSLFSSEGKTDVHEGSGPNKMRQEAPHVHFVKPSPDGKYLLAVDLGVDGIYTYDKDLNVVSVAHTDPGRGPRHLDYSEDGKTVFCLNELDSSITVFAYEDGILTKGETYTILSSDIKETKAAAIRVRGEYVYGSNRGENTIACMKWDGKTLTMANSVPCGGDSPRDFDIIDGYMFVTNEYTNNVTVFSVNGSDMEKLPIELPMENPLSVVAVDG